MVHWYQQYVTILHVPKGMTCHKAIFVINRMAHCFHEHKQNMLKQNIKLVAHFAKNSYISQLYIDCCIIIIYIIVLKLYIYNIYTYTYKIIELPQLGWDPTYSAE